LAFSQKPKANSQEQDSSSLGGDSLPYIQFLGAAGTVTGSKHLINATYDSTGKQGFQVLIDCGLFQGQKEWRERNWQDTPVPAREINVLFLPMRISITVDGFRVW
jgi:hypothetical protein